MTLIGMVVYSCILLTVYSVASSHFYSRKRNYSQRFGAEKLFGNLFQIVEVLVERRESACRGFGNGESHRRTRGCRKNRLHSRVSQMDGDQPPQSPKFTDFRR